MLFRPVDTGTHGRMKSAYTESTQIFLRSTRQFVSKGFGHFYTTEAESRVLQSDATVADPLVFLERALLPCYMAINSVLKTAS